MAETKSTREGPWWKPNWGFLIAGILVTVVLSIGRVVDPVPMLIAVVVATVGLGIYVALYNSWLNRPITAEERHLIAVFYVQARELGGSALKNFADGTPIMARTVNELRETLGQIKRQRVTAPISELLTSEAQRAGQEIGVTITLQLVGGVWLLTVRDLKTKRSLLFTEAASAEVTDNWSC